MNIFPTSPSARVAFAAATVLRRSRSARAASLALTAACGVMLLAQPAHAANRTWKPAPVNGNWNNAGNWDGLPIAGDVLFFGATSIPLLTNDYAAATNFAGLTFNAGSAIYDITGASFNLGGNIVNNSTSLQTLELGIVMTADRNFTTSAGGGNITVGVGSQAGSGLISGAFAMTKNGLGTLTFNGSTANAYTGQTRLDGGTLFVDFVNLASGTDLINSASGLRLGGGDMTIKGRATGSTVQNFGAVAQNGTTFTRVTLDANLGAGTTMALGSLAHNGGSTALFDISSSGAAITTSQAAANSLLNASYLIKDAVGTGFATKSGANMVRFDDATLSTSLPTTALSSTANYSTLNSVYTAGTLTLASGNQSMNSLVIDTTNNGGTIDLNTGIKTLTSTGVIFRGANNLILSNGQIGANNAETIVHQLGAGTLTVSGNVGSGTASLTKDGTGELILSGTNTFTGGTRVLDGKVTVTGTLGATAVVVGGNVSTTGTTPAYTLGATGAQTSGSITITNPNAVVTTTATNALGASVALTLTSGTLNLNSANALTAAINVNSGFTLGIGDNAAAGTSNLVLGGGVIRANGAARAITNTFEQGNANTTIGGTQDLTFNGLFTNKGSATLTVTNTGMTTFGGGILLRDTGTAQRSLTFNGPGSVTISSAVTNGATLNGILSFAGTGTYTLSGNNSYSGNTTLATGGLLKIASTTALGFGGASSANSNTQISSGAALDLNGQVGVNEAISINGTGLSGNGALINSSGTQAVLENGLSSVGIGAAGAGYTDGTVALNLVGGGGTGATANATIVGGVVVSVTVTNPGTGYTSNPTATVTSGAGTGATFNVGVGSVTLASASSIGGTGEMLIRSIVTGGNALTKVGAGKVTLASTNTYTGATNVNAGTLMVNGSIASSSGVTVNAGGTLAGSGGTVSGLTVNADGILAPGASIGTLNSGAVTLNGDSIFKLEIDSSALISDLLASNGSFSLALTNDAILQVTDQGSGLLESGDFAFLTYTGTWNGGLFEVNGVAIDDYDVSTNPASKSFVINGNSYQIDYNAGTDGNRNVALHVVPEPNVLVSLLGGAAILLGFRRRRS